MADGYDIIFVNPPLTDKERYGVKFKAGGSTRPTGLAMLAAVCRRAGYTTAIVDGTALGLNFRETIGRAVSYKPRVVGITAVTIAIFKAARVARGIKAKLPNVPIILGGPHVTAVPQETVDRIGCFFDIAVLGEGEDTILELLKAIFDKQPLSKVAGIAYPSKKNKARLEFTKPRAFIEDLDSLPFPAWDLLPNLSTYYSPPAHTVKRFPAVNLITSRGCPGICTFCDNKVFGRALRCYSADYVIRMVKELQKTYGTNEIQFRDDNFLVFRKRLIELCHRLIDEKIDIVWSCAGRVDMIDAPTLKLMKKAGCWQIWYGIESGSDRILSVVKKNTTQEKIRKAILATKEAGISPCGFFMVGFPTETKEDIKKTIHILLALPIDDFHMCHLSPFPGSELYTTASQYGYFDNDWQKMTAWKTIFLPKGLTSKQLVAFSNEAFRRFYLRPRIIWNYMKKVRSFHHLKVYFTAFLGLVNYMTLKHRN